MATISRVGYGQVEPNHLSAQGNRQIYAQLPLDSKIETLENGQFMKYDYANGKVDLDGEGEFMLVYNEVKLYDSRDSYKDFAMTKKNYVGEEIYPRLFKTNIGDIYTTNTFGANTSDSAEVAGLTLSVKDYLEVDATTGYLKKAASLANASVPCFQVVKEYTMPDGQPGVKIQRVK